MPGPMRDAEEPHQKGLQDGRQYDIRSQERTDPEGLRHGRTGLVVALGITAINAYIWYQWQLATSAYGRGDGQNMKYMADNFLCSRKNYNEGRQWTLVTAGFSHVQGWHIIANTLGIVSFFPAIAMRIGVVPSLLGYVTCIAGGSAASLYHAGQWQKDKTPVSSGIVPTIKRLATGEVEQRPDTPGLGASAGVFGLFTYSMLLAPTASVSIFFIPLPAWLAWGFLTGIDLYCASSEQGRQKMKQLTGVSLGHEAHLGGTSTALLTSILLMPRFWFRRSG